MEQLAIIGKEFFYENIIAFNGFYEFMTLCRTSRYMNDFLSDDFFTLKDKKRSSESNIRYNNGLVGEKSQRIVFYSDGTETNGLYREFNINKKLTLMCFYNNCLKEGIHKTFDNLGRLLTEKNYQNGKLNGIYKRYNNEKLWKEMMFIDDKSQGKAIEYYDNQNVKSECYYETTSKNGIRIEHLHGPYLEYHDDGSLSIEGLYKEGLKCSKWIYYDEYGQITKTEKYTITPRINGYQNVLTENNRFINGKKISSYSTLNGQLNGGSTEYYPDGTVKRYDNYFNGVLNGVSRRFDTMGFIQMETCYRMGTMEGYHREFSDKSLILECQYLNCELHGSYIYKKGENFFIKNYNHGKLIE
jgi:antitoxin component YwqK of YwqJK toxin-antitoxin module